MELFAKGAQKLLTMVCSHNRIQNEAYSPDEGIALEKSAYESLVNLLYQLS